MGILKKLFSKRKKQETQEPLELLSRDEVKALLHDVDTDGCIKVFFSDDNEKRYLLFKSENGYYTYRYQQLYIYNDHERRYYKLPGCWGDIVFPAISLFGTEEEAMDNLVREAEYKMYFNRKST